MPTPLPSACPAGSSQSRSVNDADAAAAHAFLRRDPFRHIMLLKYWQAFAADTEVRFLRDGAHAGLSLRIPTAASPYDRAVYPQTEQVVFLVAETPALARALVAGLPSRRATIFKTIAPGDAAAVRAALPVTRVTAFVSLTWPQDSAAAATLRPAAGVAVTTQPPADALPLYAAQGYQPDEVADYAANRSGRFYAVRDAAGGLLAACLSFRNFEHIHEIGGLHTLPPARRQGLARRLVETALATLAAAGETPRYQVDEANHASIVLARAIGLVPAVTAEHWLHLP
jgi:GNAT superfamily N-acetyltransferase